MEISQQGIAQAAELCGEGAMGMDAVDADAQNLGVRRLETRNVAFQGSELGLSATGEIENIEGKQHVALAAVIFKARLFADRSKKRNGGAGAPMAGRSVVSMLYLSSCDLAAVKHSAMCRDVLWYPR